MNLIEYEGAKAYLWESNKNPENHNFHDYVHIAPRDHLVIQDGWKQNFLPFSSRDVKTISLVSEGEADLNFLAEHFRDLDTLYVKSKSINGIDTLSGLKKLQYLSLTLSSNSNLQFNLSTSLKVFVANWKPRFELAAISHALEYIFLEKPNLNVVEKLLATNEGHLKKLELHDCNFILPMELVISQQSLRYLALLKTKISFSNNMPVNRALRFVHLIKTPMRDLQWIASLPEIDILILEDCGEIESLSALRVAKSLRGLYLSGNTKMTDGDLSVLHEFPKLKNLFIRDHKHYSHKTTTPWNWKRFGESSEKLLVFRKKP